MPEQRDKENSGHGRKRQDSLTLCSECCYEDGCNIQGCGYSYPNSTNTKCFDCPIVYEGGPPCMNTTDCDSLTKVCSVTLAANSNYEHAYRLGCHFRRQCELLSNIAHEENVKCCDKPLCNKAPFGKSNKGSIDASCSFDQNNLCSWTQATTDDFDWNIFSGHTQTLDTGPPNDHTKGNGQGNYLFIETSAPRIKGEIARLESPWLQVSSNKKICMSLWYFMYGNSLGNLTVLIEENASSSKLDTLLHLEGNKGEQWRLAVVGLPVSTTSHTYRLVIQASVGISYLGDIAIDDIQINEHVCTANGVVVLNQLTNRKVASDEKSQHLYIKISDGGRII